MVIGRENQKSSSRDTVPIIGEESRPPIGREAVD